MNTAGTITIFMPDGEMDTYSPNGAGGYTAPFRVYNTLTQIAANHFQLQFPDGTIYVYQIPAGTTSQQPFLTEIDDAYGQKLVLGYDTNVRLTTVTDAQGDVFTLSHNSSGLVTNVADPFGRNASFQYDGNNNLTQITDMGGYSSTLSYDTNAFVTSIADTRGTTSFWTELPGPAGDNSNNYPPPGDPNMFACYRITVTNAIGGLEEFFYYGGCDINGYGGCGGYSWYVSPRDYIPWQSQAINNYRSEAPKTRYLPTRVGSGQRGEFAEVLYPEGNYVQYGYDTVTGDRTSIADTQGHTWLYTYNSMCRVTSVTDAKGTTTTLTYATNNVDILSISNGLGQVLLLYNPQHDILSSTDFLTNTTTRAYNAYGQVASVVDALGITNQYVYDANNRPSTFTRAGQTLETFTWDSIGRVLTDTDPTGLTLTYSYDDLNHLLQIMYPDGCSQNYVYSSCCPHLIDSMTDRAGRTTYFSYDAMKRLTQIQNPEGGLTQFGYDANGNRTQQIDPNGNPTSFAYDLDNRLTSRTYANGNGFSIAYDSDGLVSSQTNGRGIVITYAYDANYNLLNKSYSDATPGVTNTFDTFSRLISVNDAVGTNSYTYDANSRLIVFDGPWANDNVNYSFDAIGRLTNVAVQGGSPAGYLYDALNRLTAVQIASSPYTYTYSGSNPLVQSLSRPNGSYTTYQHDSLDRLTDIANRQTTGQLVNEFTYTYNAQDMRDSETISNGLAVTFSTNELVVNSYNGLNQLLACSLSNQLFGDYLLDNT